MTYAVSVDGARLWCEQGGTAGDGLPLLLLPGQAMDAQCWAPTVDLLGLGRQVLLPDYRGIGRSSGPFGSSWSTRDFAADVITVLDRLRVGRAHVYGQSMGGRIAQWLGIDHPGRVASLTLASTTVGDRHGIPRPAEITRVLVRGTDEERGRLMASDQFCRRHPDLVQTLAPATADPAVLRAHFVASRDHDAWADLPRCPVPTLVLHGTDDEVCAPANATLLTERLPDAEHRFVPTGRHGFHVEFPRTSSWVESFVRRHDS